MVCAFEASRSGKFALLISLRDDEMAIVTIITSSNDLQQMAQPVRYMAKMSQKKALGG